MTDMNWWRELGRELVGPLTAVGCLFFAFLLALTVLTAAVGVWPPLMAVESKSMQHSDTSSVLGVINTGDVVVASRSTEDGGVQTYMGSLADGHRTFGEYGDVIVYQTPMMNEPIVHRALVKLVFNVTGGGFDVPELAKVPGDLWNVTEGEKRWWNLDQELNLYRVGYANVTVHIDLKGMLEVMGVSPHGGYVTMGDNNWYANEKGRFGMIDQGTLVPSPLSNDSIVGKVTGDIPWIGTLRLWLTGTAPSYLPHNTIFALFATIGLICALPLGLLALERQTEKGRVGLKRDRRDRKR